MEAVDKQQHEGPEIIKGTFLSRQVCVPLAWSDEKVTGWLNHKDWCGTTNGWVMREEEPIRVPCEKREGFVHIVFVC